MTVEPYNRFRVPNSEPGTTFYCDDGDLLAAF